ncbi:response regulator [Fulvivirga sp. RKSG066]|nr:response regulator [Fulvivirga aurantia]
MRVEDEQGLIDALEGTRFDLVISDNSLPKMDANRALRVVRSIDQDVPFIIISGSINQENAINAMYEGANDYLTKDDLSKLEPVVIREVKEARLRRSKHKVEKKLLQTQASYQALAQSIMDVFFAIDNALIITYWNETARREFNLLPKDVIGKYLYDVFPALKNSHVDEQFSLGLKTKTARYTTFKYSKKYHGIDAVEYFDGSIYPTADGASVILKKITDKKISEESLKNLNKELETLIYRLSHEIKGPMSSLLGLINVGRMEFQDHKINEYLDKQESSVNLLNNTLKALMNLSELKRETVRSEEIQVKSIVDSILRKMKYVPGYEDVQIIVDIDPSHKVISDTKQVQTILQNLIDNAIKFRKGRKPSLYIETIRHSSCLYLSVADNGEGIPADQQDKIYDMFYRANVNSKGPGLGLYMVKSSVEKIQGSVSMKSVEGKGCRFDIIIPDLQSTKPIQKW